MGIIQGVIELFAGLFAIGMQQIFMEPLFSFMYNMVVVFGMEANPTIIFIYGTIDRVLIPIGIALIIHCFALAGERENTGAYY